MELLLGLAFIVCGSGTICYVVRTRYRYESQVAIARDRAMLEMSDGYVKVKLAELEHEADRERRLLGDGGER